MSVDILRSISQLPRKASKNAVLPLTIAALNLINNVAVKPPLNDPVMDALDIVGGLTCTGGLTVIAALAIAAAIGSRSKSKV